VLKRRYRLLPLLYRLALEAHETGLPIVRPVFMHFDLPRGVARDQFLLGDRVLVAPVLEKAVTRRELWLPPGKWTHWLTGQEYAGDQAVVVDSQLGVTPIFIREGTALFVADPRRNAEETLLGPLALEVYPPSPGQAGGGKLFLDDGESDRGARFLLEVALRNDGLALHVGLRRCVDSFVPRQRELELRLPPTYLSIVIGRERVALRSGMARVEGGSRPMSYARIPLDTTEIACERAHHGPR
jgi:alpha-glucosidase